LMLAVVWMYRASKIFRLTQFLSRWTNWTLSKSNECPEWRKGYGRPVLFFTLWWTAWERKAFWQEAKCSFVLVPSFRFVSPKSTTSHSLQEI
jgi:hypothetical protein